MYTSDLYLVFSFIKHIWGLGGGRSDPALRPVYYSTRRADYSVQPPYYNSTWRPQPGPIPIFLASIPVLPASSPMCEQSDILTSPTYSSRQSYFPMCELPLWLTPLALAHLTPPMRAASLGPPHSSSQQSSVVSHTLCLDEELSPLLPNCKAPIT